MIEIHWGVIATLALGILAAWYDTRSLVTSLRAESTARHEANLIRFASIEKALNREE